MKLYTAVDPRIPEIIHRTPNRYAQIHIMFRVLAEKKLGIGDKSKDISQKTKEVKQYWKNFFSVDSLKDLSDEQLNELTDIVKRRINTIKVLIS